QAVAQQRRSAVARLQRPQHHEDLRDHRPRPCVRDPSHPRGGRGQPRRGALLLVLRTPFALAAIVTAVAFLASGCGAVGRVSNGDPAHGKELFTSAGCGGCHTLADAGTTGTTGPNLDDAFGPDKQQGFKLQSIEDVIRGQIAYPEKPMPANLVKGQDANDVATYIAKCAAVPACGVTATKPAPPTTSTPTTTSGGGGTSTNAAGKTVFTANCASCHTLKDAGTTGTVGPNLDQLKPAESVVENQVRHGGGVMPAFQGKL